MTCSYYSLSSLVYFVKMLLVDFLQWVTYPIFFSLLWSSWSRRLCGMFGNEACLLPGIVLKTSPSIMCSTRVKTFSSVEIIVCLPDGFLTPVVLSLVLRVKLVGSTLWLTRATLLSVVSTLWLNNSNFKAIGRRRGEVHTTNTLKCYHCRIKKVKFNQDRTEGRDRGARIPQ